jgi:hypothetical protein
MAGLIDNTGLIELMALAKAFVHQSSQNKLLAVFMSKTRKDILIFLANSNAAIAALVQMGAGF